MNYDHTVDVNDNGRGDGGFSKEMEESIKMTYVNLKANLGARRLNAPKSLENCDVEFKFQYKMLEFMDSINQKLQVGKEMRFV